MANRELPNSIEAEKGLLAIFLHEKDDKAITECLEQKLYPQMFFNKKLALVACACFELYADVQPINKENIIAVLKRRGKLDEAGGEATISELEARKDAESFASYYIEIIKDKAWRRKLIKTATSAVEANLHNKTLTQELAETISKQFLHLGENLTPENVAEAEACRKLVQDKMRELFEEAKKRGYHMRGTLRILTRLVERINKRIHGD